MNRRQLIVLLASVAPAGAALARSVAPSGAVQRAVEFLRSRQSEDGAWRSEVYGSFRSGEALTPLVTRALYDFDRKAAEAGTEWLLKHQEGATALFPVHNAAFLLELAARNKELGRLRPSLTKHLRRLQLGSELGWSAAQPSFGGWSYVGLAPRWRENLDLAPMQQSNLSPTVFAVAGLRAAGVKGDDPSFAEAATFIRSCQNYKEGEPSKFEDGGFCQMREDRWRNKGGVAGTGEEGREHFRSYFSATADGLTGLLLTGAKLDDPRVVAAKTWLRANPALNDVPSLLLYGAFARGRAQRLVGAMGPSASPNRGLESWGGVRLKQAEDGSFRNPAGEMRENDPLVATALALLA